MTKIILKLILLVLYAIQCQHLQAQSSYKDKLAHTFSIVAKDERTGEMAVGVQSHWFSVGSLVSWGRSGIGVVATQSFVNPAFGPDGLELMSKGKSAEEALEILISRDEGKDGRQVALLDANGLAAAYTGKNCIASAHHYVGKNFSVQANMMLNDNVVPAMAKAFEENDHLPLAERVMKVLFAAQEAGGDIRGRQSAALIVVDGKLAKHPSLDKKIDLRVDDHETPIAELERLLRLHKAYEHLNRGDEALAGGDMTRTLEEYGAAEQMFPENLEMRYWKAIALANSGYLGDALPIFKDIFKKDENWRELTKRLPAAGLLKLPTDDLKKIMEQ